MPNFMNVAYKNTSAHFYSVKLAKRNHKSKGKMPGYLLTPRAAMVPSDSVAEVRNFPYFLSHAKNLRQLGKFIIQ